MAYSTKPGNTERGWNDPPVFLHASSSNPNRQQSPRKSLLTKRVGHPGIFTPAAAAGSSQQDNATANSPDDATSVPAVPIPTPLSVADPPESKSPASGVVLFPPAGSTEVPKYAAPIIVPCMSPKEDSPIAKVASMATNPITNQPVNTMPADEEYEIPNFDDDEQMFHFVMGRLQRTCKDCEPHIQAKVTQEIRKKLEILSTMWQSGKISYPVKATLAQLATALHKRNCHLAHKLHLELMMDHVSEVGQWMVGVKRLIAEARNVEAPLSPTDTCTQNLCANKTTLSLVDDMDKVTSGLQANGHQPLLLPQPSENSTTAILHPTPVVDLESKMDESSTDNAMQEKETERKSSSSPAVLEATSLE